MMVAVSDNSGTGEGEWAWSLGWDCLGTKLPNRWRHSLRALSQAAALRSILDEQEAPMLQTAALLHDIGYSSKLVRTGFHPIDGAEHLRSLGVDERIVSLVAHHSCSGMESTLRGLDRDLRKFDYPKNPLVYDGLIWCDMTSGPSGELVTIDWRLANIASRYGTDSIVGRAIEATSPLLRQATTRTVRKLAYARGEQPPGVPLGDPEDWPLLPSNPGRGLPGVTPRPGP